MSDRQDDTNDDGAEVVDFDALNAALGALPPPPSSSPVIAASEGRSNANYSSARPHRIPQSVAPNEDPLAPAVIIQPDETIPSGPPVMTMPLGQGHAASVARELARSSNPSHPFTPQPFPVGSADVNATLPMQAMPRPQRHPTLVLKPAVTQPSKGQKFVVFLSMLLVFVGAGIAFLVFYRPSGIRLDLRPSSILNPPATQAHPPPTTTTSVVTPVTPIASASAGALPEARVLSPSAASASTSAPAVASSTLPAPSALPSASATAPKKPKPRPQPPAPVPTL